MPAEVLRVGKAIGMNPKFNLMIEALAKDLAEIYPLVAAM